jgi:hypothetical protein
MTLITRKDVFREMYDDSLEDALMKYILSSILKNHIDIIAENKQETAAEKEDAFQSASLVVACKTILEYYGVKVNIITDDKSKNKEKAKGRSGSRKVRNKKGRE